MFEPDDEQSIDWDHTCQDSRHYPPTLMFFSRSGWWVCPTCGHRTRIYGPPKLSMDCRGVDIAQITEDTNKFRVRPGINDTTLL